MIWHVITTQGQCDMCVRVGHIVSRFKPNLDEEQVRSDFYTILLRTQMDWSFDFTAV